VALAVAVASAQVTGTYPATPLYPSGVVNVAIPSRRCTGLIRGVHAGYTICNLTTENQDSFCQTSFINDVEDFCLWAAIKPNSTVGDVEGEMAAWCTKPSHGMRLIPESALKDGADLRGNPMGGIMFPQSFNGQWVQVREWPDFMGSIAFCLKACDPSKPNDARYCEHELDRIGCAYNAPNNAQKGDNQDFSDVYTLNGQVLTYRPQTAETRDVYEMMLSVVYTALGDQAQGVEQFAQLLNLSKVTDYNADDEVMAEEGLVIGSEGHDKGQRKAEKDIVSPHSIDLLTILGSESSFCDCENQLMELFDYQSQHIIQVFIKNRDAIVWCTTDAELVAISSLPAWTREVLTVPRLNRVQTKLYPIAFGTDEPTNVAMLTILNELSKWRNEETGEFDLDGFKIVALVQEMAENFQARLKVFGIQAGDSQGVTLTPETQIIVTTPEKWDVITRKSTATSYTKLIRLIIIDEIHLLHDDRGPVLEAIMARTIRQMEQTNEYVGPGLSATLSNYQDIATFLHVAEKKGLFHLDVLYRPYGLQQQFIGITELVFIHSRKETAKTPKFLRDIAVEKETITQFVKPEGATREILTEESGNCKDQNLLDLPFAFTIHYAGMSREDHTLVEDLFAEGHAQVLVCTATLAWGVNLHVHTGRLVELSSHDVLQMLGRAGRSWYDTFGEGVIVTNHQELQYYLSLLNQQSPIESQFASRLADNLNAEIVPGTIRTRDELVQWLGYTYMYVRMFKDPGLHGVSIDYQDESNPGLIQKRADVIHSAAVLEYNKHLKPTMSSLELFMVFGLSNEFKLLPVRQEIELSKLLKRVLIPIKESVEEPAAKINVLLQVYVSQLTSLQISFSYNSPLDAMFEICLKRGWAIPTKAALDLYKMVEKRMWGSMTPSRQFEGVSAEIIRKAEGKQFPWYRYFDLTLPEIGELIGIQNAGKLVHLLVHGFPKFQLQARAQPITRSLLRVDLSIIPDFHRDEKIHGGAETFIILVEDVDSGVILFHDNFILRQCYAEDEHNVTPTVPMFEPVPPNYYISIISDRWLHSETRLPIAFQHLILPAKFPAPTPLLDLQPLPVSALHNKNSNKSTNPFPHSTKSKHKLSKHYTCQTKRCLQLLDHFSDHVRVVEFDSKEEDVNILWILNTELDKATALDDCIVVAMDASVGHDKVFQAVSAAWVWAGRVPVWQSHQAAGRVTAPDVELHTIWMDVFAVYMQEGARYVVLFTDHLASARWAVDPSVGSRQA
ncbi:Pre-mRNA-splicing factor brr2, partial [Leucoagaricus sp. SymC.cos]